ncbi:MAG: hypothetical protein JOZ31_17045 [Verrucomicrobia bacterium]|nr:hypothetical protein [Verrucomicrobiota bacterium]
MPKSSEKDEKVPRGEEDKGLPPLRQTFMSSAWQTFVSRYSYQQKKEMNRRRFSGTGSSSITAVRHSDD